MRIGVPTEVKIDEYRVAITPAGVRELIAGRLRGGASDAQRRDLARAIGPEDVVWSYSGVRPLYDDAAANASAVTRDYVLDVDDAGGQAPALSVFGGKITTYRRLAEHAIEKIAAYFPNLEPAWTGAGV